MGPQQWSEEARRSATVRSPPPRPPVTCCSEWNACVTWQRLPYCHLETSQRVFRKALHTSALCQTVTVAQRPSAPALWCWVRVPRSECMMAAVLCRQMPCDWPVTPPPPAPQGAQQNVKINSSEPNQTEGCIVTLAFFRSRVSLCCQFSACVFFLSLQMESCVLASFSQMTRFRPR
jgi:hypothetical protein